MAGLGELIRLALRRDRIVLPAWIAALVVVAASAAAATTALYPTAEALAGAGSAIDTTPALLALYGPLHDTTSVAELAMWKPGGSGAIIVAVLMLLTAVRHTRTEEETGRLELLGSAVVSRSAPLVAALVVGFGAALVLGVLTALALVAVGLPVAGSIAFGAAWAGCAAVFTGVGAVAAQLTRGARAARVLAAGVLAVAFGLRAVGDAVGPQLLSWLSPLGWVQQVRAFAGERWWVLLLPLVATAALGLLAWWLAGIRDLDAGLLPDRAGRATAAPALRGTLTLAVRQQRGILLAWSVAFAVLAAVLGNVAAGVGALLDSDQLRAAVAALGGEQGLVDAFLAVDMSVLGTLAAVFAVQSVLRLHTEELAHRADALLAGPVGRWRWVGADLAVAAAGTVLLMLVAGVVAGLAHGSHTGDPAREVGRLVAAALVQLPAIWVLGGVALALCGLVPRFATAAWFVLVGVVLIGEIGPVARFPQWVMDLSPFRHLPHLPGDVVSAAPLVWLAVVGLALVAIGFAATRRRDIV